MPIIESAITIRRDAREIYALLRNIEAFPRFIPGIEQVRVRKLSRTQVASEWSINMEGTKVSWKEKDAFDDDSLTVKFHMTEGDFASYSGEWRVFEDGSETRLSFLLSIDWEVRQLREEIIPELERKARLAARWMLREIKLAIGAEQALSHHVTLADVVTLPETTIVSELVAYTNLQGKRIVGFFDHPRQTTGQEPMIVVPPGYGETKRDALTTAYYLVRNGFRVLRYDATDHLGESEGEITTTTMPKLKADLLATVDYIEQTFGVSQVGVVASSLAKRMAVKAAAEDPRIGFLLGVVGVVNVQETLKAIYQEDIIGDVARGRVKDFYDVLGFNIDKEYPISAIRERYHDLESTIQDLQHVNVPVVFLVAENDAWVRLDDVKLVVEASTGSPRDLHLIPEAMHQLFENPKAARIALRQAVVSATKYLTGKTIRLDEVIEPNVRELAKQNQLAVSSS
jgi:ribosome-associated toxin RatA of RatAB toxin-antitoxin module/alpha-beta hydrolase superfamily lysophospholipase